MDNNSRRHNNNYPDQQNSYVRHGGAPLPQRRSPAIEPSGPIRDATIKWFKSEKGFGFATLDDGSDAFLPASILEAFGVKTVKSGARLTIQTYAAPKGQQVTKIHSLTDAAPIARKPMPARDLGPTETVTGQVKWYNATKGFGFITPDDAGKDIFIHATVLQAAEIFDLPDGEPITIEVAESPKGREVVRILS